MLFYLFFSLNLAKNYSILSSTSKGFKNFRHMANLQVFYNILMDGGYSQSQIISVFPEDPIKDIRNITPKFESFKHKLINKNNKDSNIKKIYINRSKTIKFYPLCPTNLTLDSLIDILYLKHSSLFHLSENDNLFIYLTGHGNNNFLKISNRFFLFKDDLMEALVFLSKRLNKVLIICDTCQAESLIERSLLPSNVYAVTTSSYEEYSYSIEIDKKFGISTLDLFAFHLLEQNIEPEMRLNEFFEKFSKKSVSSKITFSKNENFFIKDFFYQEKSNEEKTKYFQL